MKAGYRREGQPMTTRQTPHRTPKPGAAGPRSAGRLQRAIDEVVRREISAALTETNGNVSEAARVLGVSRRGLWARLNSLAIDPETFRK